MLQAILSNVLTELIYELIVHKIKISTCFRNNSLKNVLIFSFCSLNSRTLIVKISNYNLKIWKVISYLMEMEIVWYNLIECNSSEIRFESSGVKIFISLKLSLGKSPGEKKILENEGISREFDKQPLRWLHALRKRLF